MTSLNLSRVFSRVCECVIFGLERLLEAWWSVLWPIWGWWFKVWCSECLKILRAHDTRSTSLYWGEENSWDEFNIWSQRRSSSGFTALVPSFPAYANALKSPLTATTFAYLNHHTTFSVTRLFPLAPTQTSNYSTWQHGRRRQQQCLTQWETCPTTRSTATTR